jgi:hypothetical protein
VARSAKHTIFVEKQSEIIAESKKKAQGNLVKVHTRKSSMMNVITNQNKGKRRKNPTCQISPRNGEACRSTST